MNTTAENPMPMTAETVVAIVDTMGALVACLMADMSKEQRARMAANLARFSAQATATGNVLSGRLIADLSRLASA